MNAPDLTCYYREQTGSSQRNDDLLDGAEDQDGRDREVRAEKTGLLFIDV